MPTLCGVGVAVVLQLGVLACSAQANSYRYTGSETNVTLNPGTYIITAYGAAGFNFNGGGLGAEMSGEFNFSSSTNLTLLVGGAGGFEFSGYTGIAVFAGSGGGGSFVVEGSTPLVVAGGGGGGAVNGDLIADGGNASITTNGSAGGGTAGGSGGAGGNGGIGGDNAIISYVRPAITSQSGLGAGGGGGFYGDGGPGYPYLYGGGGGLSFEHGGAGGDDNCGNAQGRGGGFGGGGGGYSDESDAFGGGGGGYSGGGGGGELLDNGGCGGGGGGGSFIDSSAIATLAEVSEVVGGNGRIIISAALTWNNAGGSGDGLSWDATNQNWNNGSAPALYNDGAGVIFNDANNFGNGAGENPSAYDVTLNVPVAPGAVVVSNSSGDYSICGTGSITGSTGLLKTGTSSLTLGTANTYSGLTQINQGTLILTPTGSIADSAVTIGTSGVGATSGALCLAAGSSGILVRNLASLDIVNGWASVASAATAATRSVVVTSYLTIAAGGTLDLTNNDMIVHSGASGESVFGPVSAAGTIENEVAIGRGSIGAWTGTGITSSSAAANPTLMALGVVINDTNNSGTGSLTGTTIIPGNTFDGQPVSDGDVIIKYTYVGDALLTGSVTAADYLQIDNGFQNGLTGWNNGDFNYDGVINGDDYTLIDNAFNSQGSVSFAGGSAGPAEMIASDTDQIAEPSSSSGVPEPTSMGLLAIGALALLRRGRRRGPQAGPFGKLRAGGVNGGNETSVVVQFGTDCGAGKANFGPGLPPAAGKFANFTAAEKVGPNTPGDGMIWETGFDGRRGRLMCEVPDGAAAVAARTIA
jgi:hypothetical protein